MRWSARGLPAARTAPLMQRGECANKQQLIGSMLVTIAQDRDLSSPCLLARPLPVFLCSFTPRLVFTPSLSPSVIRPIGADRVRVVFLRCLSGAMCAQRKCFCLINKLISTIIIIIIISIIIGLIFYSVGIVARKTIREMITIISQEKYSPPWVIQGTNFISRVKILV